MDYPSPADLEQLVARARAGQLPEAEAPAAYAVIQGLRALADRYERDLIRALRWDKDGNVVRTWAEVAELVDAGLSSRQAAHARWGRLKSPARNQAKRGRPRGQRQPGTA